MESTGRRLVAFATVSALLLGVLTGCGGSTVTTSSSTNSPTTADRAPHKESGSISPQTSAGQQDPKKGEDATHPDGKGHDQGGNSAAPGSSGSLEDGRSSAAKSSSVGGRQAPPAEQSTDAKQTTATKPTTAPKHVKSHAQSGKSASKCGSQERCAQIRAVEAEQAGGGTPTPADTCPAAMSAAECEAAGKALEEGGGTVTTADGCPATMSEAECRAVGEAYEAATK